MAIPTPIIMPADQATDAVLVTNVLLGSQIDVLVNGVPQGSAPVTQLFLDWRLAGNTAGFKNLTDGRHLFWTADFTGSGKSEILFYSAGDSNWWLGTFTGTSLGWTLAGNTTGFGNLADASHVRWTADFTGSGKAEILFYSAGDSNWWLGTFSGTSLSWALAGNTTGFGNLTDASHVLWTADFTGSGKSEILFYSAGDSNWRLGTFTGTSLGWTLASNTAGFGNLADGRHLFWTADFSGSGKAEILFYSAGDSNWWLGTFSGTSLSWTLASNTASFGNLTDGRHLFWTTDFTGSGKSEILFYSAGDSNWWLGMFSGTSLSWTLAGNTAGFGNLADASHVRWTADFTGLGKAEILFYSAGDSNWWLGTFSGTSLSWRLAGNTTGFGNLADGRHLFWTADFTGSGKSEILFYSAGDSNWWLAVADGVRVQVAPALTPGDRLTAVQRRGGQASGTSATVVVAHDWITEHYDTARTGWNPNESVLTHPTLAQSPLRLLFNRVLDDQTYGQPLYVQNVDIRGKGLHNVIYIVTERGTVYAWDADSNIPPNDTPLWQRTLVPPGETAVPIAWVDGCDNIQPVIGITGTPVIDRASNTIYVVAKTKTGHDPAPGPVSIPVPNFYCRLHALDLSTGDDRPNSPVIVSGSASGVSFDARYANQRAGLLLSRGIIYIAFGAHCDRGTYHGWIFSFDARTLDRVAVFNSAPAGGGGIWQAGVGPAADAEGNVYALVGNGPFEIGGPDFGDSVLKLDSNLVLVDFFTPANQELLRAKDWDIGSGAAMVLPDQPDGHHLFFTGDFTGLGHRQILFNYPTDGNWWLGTFGGTSLSWTLAGNTIGFGNLADASHVLWTADFTGSGKAEILFYSAGDSNWWLGTFSGTSLSWTLAGNTTGFGNLADASHVRWTADFTGSGKAEILFYSAGDSNWWLGTFSGTSLSWTLAGNTTGFGRLTSGEHVLWIGDFTGGGKAQILFYSAGDSNWWLGTFSGTSLSWTLAGNTGGFGDLADGQHLMSIADYAGLGRLQVLFNFAGDSNWWLGTFSGTSLSWTLAGNTTGFGNLADGRHEFWYGDFGAGHAQVLFYSASDGNWWLGTFSAGSLNWSFAGNTTGFGDLASSRRLLLACGKQGIVYLLDRDNMGRYRGPGYSGEGGPDAVVQAIPLQPGITPTAPGLPLGHDVQPGTWGGPAYYRGSTGQTVYYVGNGGPLVAYSLAGGLVRQRQSAETFSFGATPIVTSQRGISGTRVVWFIARSNPLTLSAYDGGDVGVRLSQVTAGPWNNPHGGAFLEPTVIQGKVYVGSSTQLSVFGL